MFHAAPGLEVTGPAGNMLAARVAAAKKRRLQEHADEPPALGPSFMVQRALGSTGRGSDVHGAASTQWWSRSITNACADKWDRMMPHRCERDFVVSEACAGFGSALAACRALGIPARGHTASDLKPASRSFLMPAFEHVYQSMRDQGCDGYCCCHGSNCRPRITDDVLICGPPCQPFSEYRPGRRSQGYDEHAGAEASMGVSDDTIIAVLQHRRPRAFLLENVPAFAKMDRQKNEVPLRRFITLLGTHVRDEDGAPFYTAIHVFDMEPRPWLAASRPRTAARMRAAIAPECSSFRSATTTYHIPSSLDCLSADFLYTFFPVRMLAPLVVITSFSSHTFHVVYTRVIVFAANGGRVPQTVQGGLVEPPTW